MIDQWQFTFRVAFNSRHFSCKVCSNCNVNTALQQSQCSAVKVNFTGEVTGQCSAVQSICTNFVHTVLQKFAVGCCSVQKIKVYCSWLLSSAPFISNASLQGKCFHNWENTTTLFSSCQIKLQACTSSLGNAQHLNEADETKYCQNC